MAAQVQSARVSVWNHVNYLPTARRRRSDGRVTQIEFKHTELPGIAGQDVTITAPDGQQWAAPVLEARKVWERAFGFCAMVLTLDIPFIPNLRNRDVELTWKA